MGLSFTHLPEPVAACLRAYYRRKRWTQAWRVLFAGAAMYLLLVLVATHLDRLLFLDAATRWRCFGVIHGAIAVYLLIGLARVVWRRTSVASVAYDLQHRLSDQAQELYVTLDNILQRGQVADTPAAQELLRELVTATTTHSAGLRPRRLVRDPWLRALVLLAVLMTGSAALLLVPGNYQFPLMLERFYHPGRNLPKPSFLKITIPKQKTVLGRGDEVVIQAQVSGQLPAPLRWLLARLGAAPGRAVIALAEAAPEQLAFDDAEQIEMSRVDRQLFLYTRGDLQRSFSFRVRCGDAETQAFAVEVVTQPRILDVGLHVTPPAYSRLPEETVKDFSRPLSLLPQTKVALSFRCDQPTSKVEVRREGQATPASPEADAKTGVFLYEFVHKQKTALELRVWNARGFRNVEPVKISLGLFEDSPPNLRLDFPTAELQRVPAELVAFQAQITDDLGLAELAFRYVVNPERQEEAAPREFPLPAPPAGTKSLPFNGTFDLGQTGTVPGDVLVVRLRARDTAGNDGFSREVLIHVVPFTRDENERLRLVTLRFLAPSLLAVAEAPAPDPKGPPLGPFTIPEDVYQKLGKDAAGRGIYLSPVASLRSFLELLEREHHFTDRSRHKEDLRLLAAALRTTVTPLAAMEPSGPPPDDARNFQLARLAKETLPALTTFRQLKNLTWRFYSMRSEAEQIQQNITSLTQRQAGAEEQEALKKRAELYSRTLQDQGSELIDLVRATKLLPEKTVTETIGTLNTEAHYLRSGSLKRRQERIGEVVARINEVLTMMRPVLAPALVREREARKALQQAYDKNLSQLTETLAGPDWGERWAAMAGDWLAADGRFLMRDPFAAYWARYANLLLRLRLATPAPRGAWAAADWHERPPKSAAPEQELTRRLALAWEVAVLDAARNLAPDERDLELELLCREAFSPLPDSVLGPRELRTAIVAAIALRDSPPLRIETALAEELRQRLPLPAVNEELAQLLADLTRRQRLIEDFLAVVSKGDAAAVQAAAPAVAGVLDQEVQTLNRVLTGLELRLAMPGDDAQARQRLDLLLLRLRQDFGRHLSRLSQFLAAQQSFTENGLKTSDLAALSGDLQRLVAAHQVALEPLRKLIEGAAGPVAADQEQKFPLLKELRRSDRRLEQAAALLTAAAAADVTQAFLQEFPEAGLEYLALQAGLLTTAVNGVNEAQEALRATPRDAARSRAAVQSGLDGMTRLQTVLAQVSPAEAQGNLGNTLNQLHDKLAQLAGQDVADEAAANRQLFALDGLAKELRTFTQEFALRTAPAAEDETGFRGGPDDIWGAMLQNQAELSRARLLNQMTHAHRAVTLGLLDALATPPNPDARRNASGWALLAGRLLRSDLYGIGGVRAAAGPPGQAKDPIREFLLRELDQARQIKTLKTYGPVTAEYLRTTYDFVRYYDR